MLTLLLFCGSFLCCTVLGFYRLFFHPLREYPGPVLAALTEGYEAYYNIVKGGSLVAQLERLHKQYGPVVRIGPNTLHFNYAQAYHDTYTHGSSLAKEPIFYKNINPNSHRSSFGLSNPQEAKHRRGLISPAFSRRAVISQESVIQTKVQKLVKMIEEHHITPESSVEISDAYFSFAVDVITSYCFDESFNTLDTPGFTHYLPKGFQEGLKLFWVLRHIPFAGVLLLFYTPEFISAGSSSLLKGYFKLSHTLERQADLFLRDPESLFQTTSHDTVYHHIFKSLKSHDQKRPSRTELIHEAFILFSAGSDTTSNALNVGTLHALKNPSILEKLRKELCEAFPDKDQSMSYSALENLPHLVLCSQTAFIKETLRFAIGAVHPLPRVVGPTTSAIGGLKIPAGTIVEMSTVFMHMNPDVFPNPENFNPDRWLVGDTTEMMHDFCPFSKGPRMCLGQNLAWCELYLVLGNLFRKLDLRLVPLDKGLDQSPFRQLDYFVLHWRQHYKVYAEKSY